MRYIVVCAVVSALLLSFGCGSKDEPAGLQPGGEQSQSEPAQEQPEVSPVLAKPVKPAGPEFFESAMSGDMEAVKSALDDGVDVNAQNPEGRTALM
ncbi:MAG: ankyrin repeat domain-containing protein, partial [Planctomycetes bacterium]|nr:ankyrin repeat domain-containing protein [Planctomycetota bacterium]